MDEQKTKVRRRVLLITLAVLLPVVLGGLLLFVLRSQLQVIDAAASVVRDEWEVLVSEAQQSLDLVESDLAKAVASKPVEEVATLPLLSVDQVTENRYGVIRNIYEVYGNWYMDVDYVDVFITPDEKVVYDKTVTSRPVCVGEGGVRLPDADCRSYMAKQYPTCLEIKNANPLNRVFRLADQLVYKHRFVDDLDDANPYTSKDNEKVGSISLLAEDTDLLRNKSSQQRPISYFKISAGVVSEITTDSTFDGGYCSRYEPYHKF